jgi:quinoprotein relay system zinc metallohydrolase 1
MRCVAAFTLVLLAALSLDIEAASYEYELIAEEIAPGVFLVAGSTEHFSMQNGGNIANAVFLATDAGAIVVDTGPSLEYGRALRRLVEKTLGSVRVVFNTHHHPDHFLGNGAFDDVPIVALAATMDRMRAQGEAFLDNMYRLLGPWMRGTELVLPSRTIRAASTAEFGRELRLFALTGHTGADLVLLDPATGTLICGDICFHHRAPATPNADITAWRSSLAHVRAIDAELVVPGHGPPFAGAEPIEELSAYLAWLDDRITGAVRSGHDMAELMFEPVPERFEHFDTLDGEYQRSVMHLFPPAERRLFSNSESAEP